MGGDHQLQHTQSGHNAILTQNTHAICTEIQPALSQGILWSTEAWWVHKELLYTLMTLYSALLKDASLFYPRAWHTQRYLAP